MVFCRPITKLFRGSLGKGAEDYDAEIAWAYFTYQLSDSFTVKGGRQRLPYFLYSDFLDVGYAYHWIAPPSEVYELGGFDNIDGVNLEYYGDWGPVISRINLIAGATSTTSGDLAVSSEDHWVISWNMNWDWLTFQATYSESEVTVDGINLIADGVNEIMTASGFPLTSDQLNSLSMDRDRGYFSGVGLAADWGTFFASAEYTDVGVDDSPLNNQKKSWYVSGGFRTGKFTYSLTVSNADLPNNPDTVDTLTDDLIPAAPGDQNVMFFLDQAIAGAPDTFAEYSTEQLVDAINSTLIAGYDVDTYNFTVRYDFHPSAALKFDYSKQEADYFDVYGNTTSREPELVRIGVDLVF